MDEQQEIEIKKAVEKQEQMVIVRCNECGHRREWRLHRDGITGQPIPLRYPPDCPVCIAWTPAIGCLKCCALE